MSMLSIDIAQRLPFGESTLVFIKLKFSDVSSTKARVEETLREARSAFLTAEEFLDGLLRRPLRRRVRAVYRRVFLGQKSLGFEDLKISFSETERAIDSVLLSILIAIAESKSKHQDLSSLLGVEIEDVIAFVEDDTRVEHASNSDWARLIFAIIRTRVMLLVYGANSRTARCRSTLYLYEGYVDYYAFRLTNNYRRREEFLQRAKMAMAGSRAAELNALKLQLLSPLRRLAGTAVNNGHLPLPPWVTSIPSIAERWRMRRLLAKKLSRVQH